MGCREVDALADDRVGKARCSLAMRPRSGRAS